MIKKLPYYPFLAIVVMTIAFAMPNNLFAQKTDGDKLEVTKNDGPQKMDNKKIRTKKQIKAKGNPNQGNNRVIKINPFKWDWDKVMWFKAKKSDYKTKKYNPNKRTKRETYDNKPNYKSADRDAITNPSEMREPLIPYDSRISEKGPVLNKKSKPKNVNLQSGGPQDKPHLIELNEPSQTLSKASKKERNSKVDGKRLYSNNKDTNRKPFNNSKLETAEKIDPEPKMDDDKIMFKKQDKDYSKMNNDKLMTAQKPDYKEQDLNGDRLNTVKVKDNKRKPFDDDKLMTATVQDKERKPFDDDKLMTVKINDSERKEFDESKLMIVKVNDRERKPFDNEKLMTASPANPKRKEYDYDKLMVAEKIDPKKQDLHDDRLLTVPERKIPTAEMKDLSKDISKEDGDYVRHFYVTNESHPGTKILAAENSKAPFFARTFQSISSFFTNIWSDDTQPNYVTRKKPKERRDKKEGQIWDNSVHPDTWKKPEAESGETQEN
ncbi:hypothetical protein [Marivirga arenosa]|uniref:Uncharacterized protein n=1 Tax=Marivirga arenosa TaxID=3059076 RepID=A0AA52EY68_9BACT|nr:hypothetical protein [Marivirga sp. BKB1-2]WNB17722.1 hypothetical protein QYS47_34785 [Marivirga sp. BKB1-2]